MRASAVEVFGKITSSVSTVAVRAVSRAGPLFGELTSTVAATIHAVLRTRIFYFFIRAYIVATESAVLPAGARAFKPVAYIVATESASSAIRRTAIFVFGRAAKAVAAPTRSTILRAVFWILIDATEFVAAAEFVAVVRTSQRILVLFADVVTAYASTVLGARGHGFVSATKIVSAYSAILRAIRRRLVDQAQTIAATTTIYRAVPASFA